MGWTKRYAPQGSLVWGRVLTMFIAALSKRLGSILLPENGAPKLICRPLHVGEANVVQSPPSIWAVGIKARFAAGCCRVSVSWYPPKKNNLFFLMGPPTVPPNWLRFRPSVRRRPSAPRPANGLVALTMSLRRNSNRSPWNSLVPDFVTAFTVAPP